MTDTLKPFADRLTRVLGHIGLSAGTLKIDISGVGSLTVAGYSVGESQGNADCMISVEPDVLNQFLDGTFDPHWALVCGRITYVGDFAVARAFGGLLSGPRPA